MNTKIIASMLGICGALLCNMPGEVWAVNYSVTVYNDIHRTNLNTGCPCNVFLTYNGSNTATRQIQAYGPQTFSGSSTGACSSVMLTATCHYFQSSYTNYGQATQSGYSTWVDETKTQIIPCGTSNVSIGLTLYRAGSTAVQVLNITPQ